MIGVFIRGERSVKTEAETGGVHLQAEGGHRLQQPPDTRGKAWDGFCLRASRRNQPCLHFKTSGLQDCERIRCFCCFEPPSL